MRYPRAVTEMKPGRNDPCPCGSGRKYKKCCLTRDREKARARAQGRGGGAPWGKPAPADWEGGNDVVPLPVGDYGEPALDEAFIDGHEVDLTSQVGGLYLRLVLPEVYYNMIRVLTEHIPEDDATRRMIERTDDPAGLVDLMRDQTNPLCHRQLMDKVLDRAVETVPIILERLEEGAGDETFVELAAVALHDAGGIAVDGVRNLVQRPVENAYTLSVLCMVLGRLGDTSDVKTLWDLYHHLSEHFPDRSYDQGPLIGLWEHYFADTDGRPGAAGDLMRPTGESARLAIREWAGDDDHPVPELDPGKYNATPLDDFDGFTPREMYTLLYNPFDADESPMVLNNSVDLELADTSWFYRDVRRYLGIVADAEPIRLTARGNLPPTLCREMVEKGFVHHEFEREYYRKNPLRREGDCMDIRMMRIMGELAGLTVSGGGRLRLTEEGRRLKEDGAGLFLHLFKTYTQTYNWSYEDGYPDSAIIQTGFGFTLHLIQRYGGEPRRLDFYVDKYLRAFPQALDDVTGNSMRTRRESFLHCFAIRVVERFLGRFGLATMERTSGFVSGRSTLQKTPLLDDLVGWRRGA